MNELHLSLILYEIKYFILNCYEGSVRHGRIEIKYMFKSNISYQKCNIFKIKKFM